MTIAKPRQAAAVAQSLVARGVKFVRRSFLFKPRRWAAAPVLCLAPTSSCSAPLQPFPPLPKNGSWAQQTGWHHVMMRRAGFCRQRRRQGLCRQGLWCPSSTDGSPLGSALARSFKIALNAGGPYREAEPLLQGGPRTIMSSRSTPSSLPMLMLSTSAATPLKPETIIRRLRDLASPCPCWWGGDPPADGTILAGGRPGGRRQLRNLDGRPRKPCPPPSSSKARPHRRRFQRRRAFHLLRLCCRFRPMPRQAKATGGTDSRAISGLVGGAGKQRCRP